jgi:hypothetical protein
MHGVLHSPKFQKPKPGEHCERSYVDVENKFCTNSAHVGPQPARLNDTWASLLHLSTNPITKAMLPT